MDITDKIKLAALKKACEYLEKDPDKNIPKMMDWVDTFDRGNVFQSQRKTVRNAICDPNSNWYGYLRGLWTDIDSGVLKKIFENFLINAAFIGWPRQEEARAKYDCNIPWAILLDPTSACNMHCTGCWAAEYGNKQNLSLDTIDRIINDGVKLGTYFYIYTGGEPLVRKKELITVCERHPDCIFLSFTNGTLIDDAFCREMLRVKNFIPAVSVEGFEEATDSRRGKGAYAKVERAMELMRSYKLPFGISCCYTSQNVSVIGSGEYFDKMISWGAKFAWFFTYMPIGADAVPSLMTTAGQREFMYHRIREFRGTKPIFTMDFWNDGEYVGGCIAGGRRYLHINAAGDCEPCVFIHYSNVNINDCSLLDALRSPLFMEYYKNQPFNENMLRPCPVLDNPDRLPELVKNSGAHSTDLIKEETASDYCAKCVGAARNWAPVADGLWKCSGKCNTCEADSRNKQ